MEFRVSERFLHPDGTFVGTLQDYEEKVGKFGPRLAWRFQTNYEREDGEPALLSIWTGMNFSPKAGINQLLNAMGVTPPETDEEAAEFDPADLIGKRVRLIVTHTAPSADGTVWANAVASALPQKKAALAGKTAPKKAAAEPEEEDAEGPTTDPFESE